MSTDALPLTITENAMTVPALAWNVVLAEGIPAASSPTNEVMRVADVKAGVAVSGTSVSVDPLVVVTVGVGAGGGVSCAHTNNPVRKKKARSTSPNAKRENTDIVV
jgi:hypothetical protein